MNHVRFATASCLGLLIALGHVEAADLPVKSVVLSNAGLIHVERYGDLAAGEGVSFQVPIEDVDDVLKSLLVLDAAGSVEGVRLPARDGTAEAFRGLPLRREDFDGGRARLLQALRGQAVEAGGVSGLLADAQEGEGGSLRISIVTDQGLKSVVLGEGAEVTLQDKVLAGRVRRAAEAVAAARSADTRKIDIALRADRVRPVTIAYVAGAPLWKPTYRLLVPADKGEARLQGWAVLENRSGSDWDNVRLALVSGNPATFRQPLYETIRIARQELPVRVPEGVNVQIDTGARPMPLMAAAPLPPPQAMRAPPPAMGMAFAPSEPSAADIAERYKEPAVASAASAPLATMGRIAFVLPEPVSIRGGETANVPFIDATLPAERFWWMQRPGEPNPLMAVRVKNSTQFTLPIALSTVYGQEAGEAGAFLGDAELPAMTAGEERLVAFGRDRDVSIATTTGRSRRPVSIEFYRGGLITVREIERHERTYAIETRGAKGRMIVEVSVPAEQRPVFAAASKTQTGVRAEIELDGATKTVRLDLEQDGKTDIRIWNAALGDPTAWRFRELDTADLMGSSSPIGPNTLAGLQSILARLPADAAGRADLVDVIERIQRIRVLLDEAREAANVQRSASLTLTRAREAGGSARPSARRGPPGAQRGVIGSRARRRTVRCCDIRVDRRRAATARQGQMIFPIIYLMRFSD